MRPRCAHSAGARRLFHSCGQPLLYFLGSSSYKGLLHVANRFSFFMYRTDPQVDWLCATNQGTEPKNKYQALQNTHDEGPDE